VLVDTHCHLVDSQFADDRAEVIARARQAGVNHIVVIADSLESTRHAIDLAESAALSATAGVHPHVASGWTAETEPALRAALTHPAVVAVGEAGLDYHYDHSPRDAQRSAFGRQLELASTHHLPIVVHSRSADADIVAMLRDADATAVLHSFSSGPEVLAVGLERGDYISFSGMVTFRSWTDIEAVQAVPADRLLVETDAPYLAPVPHRGKRNEPAFVADVARRVAELRGVSVDELTRQTTENAARCFGPRITLNPHQKTP